MLAQCAKKTIFFSFSFKMFPSDGKLKLKDNFVPLFVNIMRSFPYLGIFYKSVPLYDNSINLRSLAPYNFINGKFMTLQ